VLYNLDTFNTVQTVSNTANRCFYVQRMTIYNSLTYSLTQE